jgi:hypothetical protein
MANIISVSAVIIKITHMAPFTHMCCANLPEGFKVFYTNENLTIASVDTDVNRFIHEFFSAKEHIKESVLFNRAEVGWELILPIEQQLIPLD